jgi:adenylate cyclase
MRSYLLFSNIPLRQKLLLNSSLVLLFTLGSILFVVYIAGQTTVNDLSTKTIDSITDKVEMQLQQMLGSIDQSLLGIESLLQTDLFQEEFQVHKLNEIFRIIIQMKPQISSINISNELGQSLLLIHQQDQWVSRITDIKNWGKNAHWIYWDENRQIIRDEWKESDYDPRDRVWYQGAMDRLARESVYWTSPYEFHTTHQPGISASTAFVRKTAEKQRSIVISFDILLVDFMEYVSSLDRIGNANVVVMSDDLHVVGILSHTLQQQGIEETTILQPVQSIPDPLIKQAVTQWEESEKHREATFQFYQAEWWAGFRPFLLGDRMFWIGVFVPERDFLHVWNQQQGVILFISILSILLSLYFIHRLTSRISAPLSQLSNNSRQIATLSLPEKIPIESNIQEVKQLIDSQKQMVRALKSFSRYVPVNVVRQLLEKDEVARIGGDYSTITVLFTDIRNFTSISEKFTPRSLLLYLADYFENLIRILHEGHATVDKILGDGLVVFWGAPNPDEHHIIHAVRSAFQCREWLKEYNRDLQKFGLPSFPTCFGLDTGKVMVGNIGSHTRLNYTAMGDTLNLASRVEGLNRIYDTAILATETVRNADEDEFLWRYVDRVVVKGKTEDVNIYELVDRFDSATEKQIQFVREYEQALRLYQEGLFSKASERLGFIREYEPENVSVYRLMKLCEEYRKNPPPSSWDGITRFTFK